MYTTYFGIEESPFSITPDPRFLYMSQQHLEALGYLLYGVSESGGFVLLTGEVGAGKTTVCRCLLEQLPENVDAALILNPRLTAYELVATLCDDLGIDYPLSSQSLKVLFDALNRHLLEAHGAGRRTVLIIDESQNLSPDALEQIRLLTNLETNKHKLLQIILIGQPELRDMLDRSDLRQLSQRVTARFHLPPLSQQETLAYIEHRLSVVGLNRAVFNLTARRRVYQHSGGVPRLINTICDRALLGVYAEDRKSADWRIIDKAAEEVTGKHLQGASRVWLISLILLLVAGIGGFTYSRVANVLVAQEDIVPADTPQHSPVVVKPGEAVTVESAPAVASPPAALEESALGEEALTPGSPQVSTAVSPTQPLVRIEKADDISQPELDRTDEEQVQAEQSVPVMAESATVAMVSKAITEKSPTAADTESLVSAETMSTVDDLIQESPVGNLEVALNDLFSLWGIDYAHLDGNYPCKRAIAAKLECLHGKASLQKLRTIDRPAIIEVAGKGSNAHFVVLVGLQEKMAQVQVGSRVFKVPLDGLARVYTGDYLLLWHPPVSGIRYLQLGMRGNAVRWLRERLSGVKNWVETTGDASYFDNRLYIQLREFQRAQGLDVDGIAGPMTMISLNNLVNDASVPRL